MSTLPSTRLDIKQNKQIQDVNNLGSPLLLPFLRDSIDQDYFLIWKKLADKGSTEAQLKIAQFYEDGNGIEQSDEQAFYYYSLAITTTNSEEVDDAVQKFINKYIEKKQEAAFDHFKQTANHNDPLACYLLAQCYLKGFGLAKSVKNAFEYFQKAARLGYPCRIKSIAVDLFQEGIEKPLITQFLKTLISQNESIMTWQFSMLAELFEKGIEIEKSLITAIDYYKFAYTKGLKGICYHLGNCLEKINDGLEAAIYYYQQGSQEGCFNCSYRLAQLFENEVLQQVEKAFEYYQLASKQNCQMAIEKLTSSNVIICLRPCEDQKSAEDSYNLGLHFKEDHIHQDFKKAFDYFKQAAKHGYPKAAYQVGVAFKHGQGIEQSYEQAIKYFLSAAIKGLPEAQNELGNAYRYGQGAPINQKQAVIHYQASARQGNSNAQYNLGDYFVQGIGGLKQSHTEAFRYYKLASDQGLAEAQYALGICYLLGRGVEASWDEALKYYQSASEKNYQPACEKLAFLENFIQFLQLADKGDADAQVKVAQEYLSGLQIKQSNQKAYDYLKLASHQKHPKALYVLGNMYRYNGRGITQSDKMAVIHYQAAADQGYDQAQFELGNSFEKGFGGLKQSYEEAFKYYKLAADQGLATAQHALATYYLFGRGIEESWSQALKYYRLASKQGHQLACKQVTFLEDFIYLKRFADEGNANSQLKLAREYLSGLHIKQSYQQAYEYFKLASEQGKSEASYELGRYEQEINKSWDKALIYFKRAAHQKNIKAIWLLFKHYHYGKLCKELQENALEYLHLGIELDNADCQYYLGEYYKYGWGGLTPSLAEAFKYYKLAAQKGHENAIRCLQPRILHPLAKPVDIHLYEQDQNPSTFREILQKYSHQPVFLEMSDCSWEEAQIICEAMIENARFTFMSPTSEMPRLFLAFELAGYQPEKDLVVRQTVNPSTNQETWGYVFIAHDVKNSDLKSVEDDPQQIAEMHLETLIEAEREKCRTKAYEIHQSLPEGEIKYPGSQEIDITPYLHDHCIDTLKSIFLSSNAKPIHLYLLKASYEEILAIRDAMIQNPRFCFFCNDRKNLIDLEEAFYRAGYHDNSVCLKKKREIKEGKDFFGYIFIGKKEMRHLFKES